MTTFLLLCPQCKNQMRHQTNSKMLAGKSKKCVYCGRNFAVKNSVLKQISK